MASMIAGTVWMHTGTSQAALDWESPVPPIKFVP
jgi:hypothetical protein